LIYVSEDQLKQVEYIIGQSVRGHHVLFDNETVRKAFLQRDPESVSKDIEKHIEELITQPTLLQKRAYLEKLPLKVRNRVVKMYFNIIENNIFESMETVH
jgi:hypothetical protein